MNSTALAAQFRTSCRAFRHRNYQFYFVGQLVSNIGNWVQSVAQAWLVYQLTGSSELLGVTAFAQQIPFFLFGPLAGAVADRYDRRVTLLITHWSAILLTFTLALLTLTGMVQVWQVVTIALLHGTVNSVDIPTRQAFVREIVGLEDLPNAVALNSSMLTGLVT